MDFRRPLRVVTPTLDGDVLNVLATGDVEVSGRELHRLVGHSSEEGVRRAASRLVSQGIVTERIAGRSRLYALNRDHLAAPPIVWLAGIRGQLIQRLRDTVQAWEMPVAAAVLFGSVARRTASESSDLDVLVVRGRAVPADHPTWREQLERLSRDATSWTGNDTRILEFAEVEVLAEPATVVLEALREGVDLHRGRQMLRRIKQADRG